jgi:Arc/MetJ-type ribon-helix-helix transcriptional regulator
MTERVISVKMPGSLVKELRTLTAAHHYLDFSEQVRSVVRQKCLKYTQPYDDVNKIKQELEQQIKSSNQMRKEQILQELQRLLEEEK